MTMKPQEGSPIPTPHGQTTFKQGHGVHIKYDGVVGHVVSHEGTDVKDLYQATKRKSLRRLLGVTN